MGFLPCADGTLRLYLADLITTSVEVCTWHARLNFWNAHFDSSFSRYPLWIAEYGVDRPTLPAGWSTWLMWQYEENAAVPGIEKGADRSRLHPEADVQAIAVQPNPPSP